MLSLGYIAIAARTLGPDGFGRFAIVLTAAQGVVTLVTFQTWQVIVQYGAEKRDAGDRTGLAALIRACCLLDVASALAGCLIAVLAVAYFGPLFGLRPDLKWDALLFAAALLVSIRSTPLGVLRLHGRWGMATAADMVMPAMRLAGAGAAALSGGGIAGFLAAWASAELLTATAYWILAIQTGEMRAAARARLNPATFLADNPGFWRFAFISNIGATLALIGRQISILMAGALAGPAAAGGFRLAFQLAQALTRFSQILARATFPELVNIRAAPGHGEALSRTIRSLDRIAFAVAGVALVILVFAGEPLLLLIGGPAYASSYWLLLLLGVAGCIDLASVSYEPALTATGRAGTALAIRLGATALLLASQAVLVTRYGLVGVGIAMLLGSTVAALLLGAAARLRKPPPGSPARLR